MGKDIKIKAHDGGSFSAYVVKPQTDLPAAAVVVIQEIFGVNAVMRDICNNLAGAGYITICPDLFWRQEPGLQLTDKTEADWQRAFELFNGFDIDLGIEDLKTTLAHVRKDKDCNVCYYGVGIDELLDEAPRIKKQLLMHIAERDQFVPMEAQQKILAALNKHKNVEIHVYPDVDHAFARVDGQHYDKEAAGKANFRSADFLATHLSPSKTSNGGLH
ncbi:MAG: dienelactone hydrolase family protein [Alphaproteobacteria bacterium]|nr:dienelactone hydrolase family protein [Alphaproteobacteria bacterium]